MELDEAAALAAGLWLDATAESWDAVPGGAFAIQATALRRSALPLRLVSVSVEGAPSASDAAVELPYNQPVTRRFTWKVPAGAPFSQPFWLVEPRQGDTYTIRDQTADRSCRKTRRSPPHASTSPPERMSSK